MKPAAIRTGLRTAKNQGRGFSQWKPRAGHRPRQREVTIQLVKRIGDIEGRRVGASVNRHANPDAKIVRGIVPARNHPCCLSRAENIPFSR
jgi:hypothetical protein